MRYEVPWLEINAIIITLSLFVDFSAPHVLVGGDRRLASSVTFPTRGQLPHDRESGGGETDNKLKIN
jgi:hypothetical protein